MQDKGQGSGTGDRLKVRTNAGLHWFIVVGHDRKHRVGAGQFGAPRQLYGLIGRIRSRAGNDTDAPTRDLDGSPDELVLLDRRKG